MNPNYKSYETNPLDLGVSEFWKPSLLPNISANIGGSTSSEIMNTLLNNLINGRKKDK